MLFLPLGVTLTFLVSQKAKIRALAFFLILTVVFIFSLSIETLQNFIFAGFPSTIDILANVLGGALGFISFQILETNFPSWKSGFFKTTFPSRSVVILICVHGVYMFLILFLFIPISGASHLSNWEENVPLLVGNEKTGDRPWRGHVYEILDKRQGY